MRRTSSDVKTPATKTVKEKRRDRLRDELQTLEKEMQVVQYHVNSQNQVKKRIPRKEWKDRTKKRKLIEKEEELKLLEIQIARGEAVMKEMESINETDGGKDQNGIVQNPRLSNCASSTKKTKRRLRGSKASFEDEIVNGSMIFGGDQVNSKCANDSDGEINADGGDYEVLQESNDSYDEMSEASMDRDIDQFKKKKRQDSIPKDEKCKDDHEENKDVDGDSKGDDKNRYEMCDLDFSDDSSDYSDRNDGDGDDEEEDDKFENSDQEEGNTSDDNKKSLKKGLKFMPTIRSRSKSAQILTSSQKNMIKMASKKVRVIAPKSKRQACVARRIIRLKNFKSTRMAHRHGEALGLHARGMDCIAVEKLGQVASGAPIAPQLYSSLGLVYENALREEEKHWAKNDKVENKFCWKTYTSKNCKNHESQESITYDEKEKYIAAAAKHDAEMQTQRERLCYRLDVAKRAYGSCHVAAILYRRDPSLWMRAGDAAMEIADLHGKLATIPPPPDGEVVVDTDVEHHQMSEVKSTMDNTDQNPHENDVISTNTKKGNTNKITKIIHRDLEQNISYHFSQRTDWLNEARDDYHEADKLRPPGIAIPAKLALVNMELGALSDALTILTDLKNMKKETIIEIQKGDKDKEDAKNCFHVSEENAMDKLANTHHIASVRERSEFEQSYEAWALYANLMLRIGHQCVRWSHGDCNNNNYMFRRWLKKYYTTFDWKERRLQALCMALEAAAGSKSCEKIVSWVKERAVVTESKDKLEVASMVPNNDENKNESNKSLQNETFEEIEKESNDFDNLSNIKKEEKRVDRNASLDLLQSTTLSTSNSTSADFAKSLEEYRSSLLLRHKARLKEFDEATIDMDIISGSLEEKNRLRKREELVKNQKKILVDCIGEHARKLKEGEVNQCVDEGKSINESKALHSSYILAPSPMSASCATVFEIATQLLRQCLELKLYRGGRLAAEAVSSYLRERFVRHEKWKRHLEVKEQEFQLRKRNVLSFDNKEYGIDNNSDENDSGNESDQLFSDDELLRNHDNDDQNKLLSCMKRGILSHELQCLYALSLIGEGNGSYISKRLLNSVHYVEDVTLTDAITRIGNTFYSPSTNDDVNTKLSDGRSWESFRRAMEEPFDRLALSAYISEVIRNTGKEAEWSTFFIDLISPYFNLLEKRGELALWLESNRSSEHLSKNQSLVISMRRNHALVILLGILRMRMRAASSIVEQHLRPVGHNMSCDERIKGRTVLKNHANYVVESFLRFESMLWQPPHSNATLNATSIEALSLLSRALKIWKFVIDENDVKNTEACNEIISLHSKVKSVVTIILGISLPDHHEVNYSTRRMITETWRHFPIPCEWQEEQHTILSRYIFNFCVACNVSDFSGWENDEFELKMLRKKWGRNYFGIKVSGVQVAGYISPDLETELSDQWDRLQSVVPSLGHLDFDNGLVSAKKADWCVDAIKRLSFYNKTTMVASFGEDDALQIVLFFSRLSLQLAVSENDNLKEEGLLKNMFSIIIPMSQFCLDQTLWNSHVGTSACCQNYVKDWKDFLDNWSSFAGSEEINGGVTITPPPCRQKPSFRPSQNISKVKSKHDLRPAPFLKKSTLSKLIKVPIPILLQEWKGNNNFENASDENCDNKSQNNLNKWSQNPSGSAVLAMRNLDYSMKKLRECFTINTLQRTSLQVASALLDVTSHDECNNPFLCLHQAASFASQGSKGGNNDALFKKALPIKEECTSQEALSILGRADCMRAVHFTDEAMFLCSYVATVCRLHRDKKRSDLAWTPRWRAVGIQMYTVSMAIDATIYSLMDGETRMTMLESWQKEVKDEVGRARSDAVALTRAFTRINTRQSSYSLINGCNANELKSQVNKIALNDDKYFQGNDQSGSECEIQFDNLSVRNNSENEGEGQEEIDSARTDFEEDGLEDGNYFRGQNQIPLDSSSIQEPVINFENIKSIEI